MQHDGDWIEVSLLCCYVLSNIAKVKIEWVDSLSMHLEFDMYTKVLKIFRLPSLCLLMCCCKELSPLSQYALNPYFPKQKKNYKKNKKLYESGLVANQLTDYFPMPQTHRETPPFSSKTQPSSTARSYSPTASYSGKTAIRTLIS
jgi:hypothetical protein